MQGRCGKWDRGMVHQLQIRVFPAQITPKTSAGIDWACQNHYETLDGLQIKSDNAQ